MMPDQNKIKEMEREMRHLANIPNNYTVEVNVQSLFMCDAGYRVVKTRRAVEIMLYAEWLPKAYDESKIKLGKEISNKMGWKKK
jgi:hypothetical protein